MATLFDEKQRTRKEPLKRGERIFHFYDECARVGYDEFRKFVNLWISELPEQDREEIIARMKSGNDRDFQAALAELVVHAALKRLGCDIKIHPSIEGTTKRPDFAIVKDGNVVCYVEVTTINVAVEESAEKNRENVLYNAIDRAKLPPGCLLGYSLERAGKKSPRTGPVVQAIEEWARTDHEQAKGTYVTRRFSVDDWEVEIDLLCGGSKETYENSIGIADGGAGWIAPHLDLRNTLNLKARRYGKLAAPYLTIVADAKGQLFGAQSVKDAITEAVLGDEVVRWREGQPAKVEHAINGFWRGKVDQKTRK